MRRILSSQAGAASTAGRGRRGPVPAMASLGPVNWGALLAEAGAPTTVSDISRRHWDPHVAET
jgi:hypothetical protein